ncbi:MAG: hypothetical protein DRJ28_09175 [Actinobacteria bacterium]|nr:MAG: hypothetical protein DRJ28_09175 [Actinomycetota bacterium]
MRRALLVMACLALIASACSSTSDGDPLIGIRASSDPAVGDDRLLFAVHEVDGTRRGTPDEVVTIVASPLDSPDVEFAAEATFTWIVPDAMGLYLVNVPFDRPGTWEIDFAISTGEPTDPFLVDIQEKPRSTAIGEVAPLVETPTIPGTPLEDLTTDHDPLTSMYEVSLDTALSNGRRTVVIFATPAFCTSAACGPMLEQTKTMAVRYPDVDFLHVEVYGGFNDPGFAPDPDHLVPAVIAFGLPSEPWVFVIDEHGIVTGRFDGVLGVGEVEALLDM